MASNSLCSLKSAACVSVVVCGDEKKTRKPLPLRACVTHQLHSSHATRTWAVIHCCSRYWCIQIQNIIHFFPLSPSLSFALSPENAQLSAATEKNQHIYFLFFFKLIFTHDNKLKITFDTLNNWTLSCSSRKKFTIFLFSSFSIRIMFV